MRALQLSLELWHFYQKVVVVVFNLVGFIIRIRARASSANMFDCCSFREAGRRTGSPLELCGGLGLSLFYLGQLATVRTLLTGLLLAFVQIRKRQPSSQGALLGKPSMGLLSSPTCPPWTNLFVQCPTCTTAQSSAAACFWGREKLG